jgi:hypothetical protein
LIQKDHDQKHETLNEVERILSVVRAIAVFSMPGSAEATLRKSALMLNPSFALVSMNIMSYSLALASPSSTDTLLWKVGRGRKKKYGRGKKTSYPQGQSCFQQA